MSTLTSAGTATAATLSRKNKIGLGLAIVLGLFDLSSPFTTPSPSGAQAGPPMSVLVADAVLGLVAVIAAVYALRTANRVGSRIVAGSRVLSAATSLPAFFVGGVPAALIVLASTGILVTLVDVWLVLARPASPASPAE